MNFASSQPARDSRGEARLVLGSFGTTRASVGYESGLFNNGFHVSGRFSYANTDGYRERSGSEHHTLFLNAGWQGERSALTFVAFSGQEQSQLAYLAVDPETLSENRRFNPLTEEDRDNFGQDFAQVKYMRELGSETVLTASFYYNGAAGWFQLWDDPVAQNDLLRFGIGQGFFGSMVTVSTQVDNLTATVGVHYNDFSGDHFLDSAAAGRVYKNTGFKKTANAFGKLEYRLGQTILFGDLHWRRADFSYEGDVDLGSVDWTFLDPKIGVRQILSPGLSLYGSLGRAQREPARLDLLLGEDNASVGHDLEAVKPESVVNFEGGVNFNTPGLALAANAYLMEFRDEIALTGELSEVGLPLRRNVDRSYRRGVEIDLKWRPASNWTILHSLNLSRNRIKKWTQFYDVFDEQGTWIGGEPIVYRNVRPLLTPQLMFNLGAEWANHTTSVGLLGSLPGRVAARQHGALPIQDTVAHKPGCSGLAEPGAVVRRIRHPHHAFRQQCAQQSRSVPERLQLSIFGSGWRRHGPARRHPLLLPLGDPQLRRLASVRLLSTEPVGSPACFLWSSSPSSSRCWPSS